MNNKEKVIKALELCKTSWECKKECPYYGESPSCGVYDDAIALLKGDEVKMVYCDNCGFEHRALDGYCPKCGEPNYGD